MIRLMVLSESGETRAQGEGKDMASLVFEQPYEPGDRIALETDSWPCHLIVVLEDSLPPACLYMAEGRHEFVVPLGEKRICYSPKSFSGAAHLLHVRRAQDWELRGYRNLAFNPLDQHENRCLFPHAEANVETRGESVFAARNAIDGRITNRGHGPWPYQSWGINRDPRAEMQIDFGRDVLLDRAVITTRADFPHDSHWVRATLAFSDGTEHTFRLIKTDAPQPIEITQRRVSWATLKNLIKADDDSPFPALSQIELWGTEA